MPSGRHVDVVEWLAAPTELTVAGVLGYELAWELLDIRAHAPEPSLPRVWVGRFEGAEPIDDIGSAQTTGVLTAPRCRQSAAEYQDAVRRCIRDIVSGELFEVNYTARFDARYSGTKRDFYDALQRSSTGEYFGLLDVGPWAVASVSPESFVSVVDGVVETRPIKGTRARRADPREDEAARNELLHSDKDRAENIMIVDLMRNDLTPVCELGTVEVTGLCELETFAGVHHLVSTVRGKLREGHRPIDVLLRCFPAGSITGAPKLRAIEIAADAELGPRGFYTGTMFVATPESLRSSVLIRTATLQPDATGVLVEYGAGGAIVSDSNPEAEWAEALAKCAPLNRLLNQESH